MDEGSSTPLSTQRNEEVTILQLAIDELEEPSDLSEELESEGAAMEATKPKQSHKPEVERLKEDAERYGLKGVRAKMNGYVTRNNQYTIMPFIVDQLDEPTCSYVTLSKVLIFNLMGLLMDIEVSPSEKMAMHKLMKSYPLTSDTTNEKYLIPYSRISIKVYVLILFFFYFFEWIKKHDIRPYLLSPSTYIVEITNDFGDFNVKLADLFDFLKLKKKRLGGPKFKGSDWIIEITTLLEDYASLLVWKRTSFNCLRSDVFCSSAVTLDEEQFKMFCDQIILPITNQGMKVIINLCNGKLQHDVMLVGIENESLLISNSWGHSIDVVPIELLPSLTLKNSPVVSWSILQFSFLLPVIQGDKQLDGLERQYDFRNYGKFLEFMSNYKIPTFPKLDPTTLGLRPTDGGSRKRKKHTRRNKSKHLKKKLI